MHRFSLISFWVLILFATVVNAQDTLTFLNGKVAIGKVTDSNVLITKIDIKKNKKTKSKSFESSEIFTVRYNGEEIDTLYEMNEEKEYLLTPLEMQYFIYGEQDARQHFQPKLTAIGGLVFGGVLGYFLHDGAYVAAVPLVYTVASGVSTVKIKDANLRSSAIVAEPAYQEGYIKVARTKKAFRALAGSAIGTFLGVLVANGTN